jgi:hypothetical protein
MTAASHRLGPGVVLAVTVAGLLAGCTGAPAESAPTTTAPSAPSASRPTSSASPSHTLAPRPPLPTASAPSTLPGSPPEQLTPVSSSPKDLGRIDIRDGSPSTKRVAVRLPAGSGYTVTAGCLGRAGTLLRWSVVGTTDADPGFLFGSTAPCNGSFLTDAAMANIDAATSARLEVSIDPGVQAATVVLRAGPADSHL